jgi:3-hydroxy-9,10-secoandrosta-1,3,5(10)-triene-9,17-dione monooxygenase
MIPATGPGAACADEETARIIRAMTATNLQRQTLVERASGLVPMLRERAASAERERRVPQENLDALSDAGIFRMMAPAKYGGEQASFDTQCEVLAEIARGCPSTSWVATIYSAMTWLVSGFSDEAQDEVFGETPRISGVFSPTGTARRRDGGFMVSGRWGFNTGCHGSEWTVLNAVLDAESGQGLPLCVVVRSRELKIVDDWYATGMAATGSNTIVAENVFVPDHRALPLPELVEGKYPERRHNAADPYFNYPLASVLAANAGGTPIGIARGAIDAFFDRLPGRGIAYTYYTNKTEAPITHLQVGEASLKLESADAHVRRAAAILDRHAGGPIPKQARVKVRAHISYATGLARETVDTLFNASGATAIQTQVPIQRLQRDMQALANHAVLHAQTGMELYGRVLCGLEPNTFLY